MYTSYEKFDNETGFSAKAGFQLSPLQVVDIEQLINWDISLNRMEVGCGKTVVSSAVALMRQPETVVVIVPPILIRPWVRWLTQISDSVLQYEGTPTERRAMNLRSAKWIVVSHAIFRTDFQAIRESLAGKDYEGIVDEAHGLKNIKSVLYKKVTTIFTGHRLQLLTGTPTSKPVDAYSYIKLKTPGVYRSLAHFESVHVEERDFFKKPTKWMNLEMLSENLAIKSVHRTKEELHGYNNKPLYPDTHYRLSPEHYRLYEKLVNEQLLLLPTGDKIDASTAVKLYHQIQQLVVNLDYFSGDPEARSTAYDLVDQTIESTDCVNKANSKLIIWTLYKRTSASMLAYLRALGIKTVAAYSGANSQDSFDAFMEDEATRILVAQPQSAGAGLNPQSVCSQALFIETSPVPLYNIQACGRIDRMGQKRVPIIRYAVAEGTIQESLVRQLICNEDIVARVEGSKAKLKDILLGR